MKNVKLYKNEIDYIKEMINDYERYIINDNDKKFREYKKYLKYKKIILLKLRDDKGE